MLFLGDSESYLATAVLGWIPPDRSFLYGMLLNPLVIRAGSVWPMLVAQSACSVIAAVLLAKMLTDHFYLPWRVAFLWAILWAAAEPFAVLYERYFMTEAFALLGFSVFVFCSLEYIEKKRWRHLALAQVAAIFVVAFRMVFIPISMIFAVLLPIIGAIRQAGGGLRGIDLRRAFFALVVSLVFMFLGHQGYKRINGALAHDIPAYQYQDGLFLMAAWAPVIALEDFENPEIGKTVLTRSKCNQADRSSREAQRWYPGCLTDQLIKALGDERLANVVAGQTARNALKRDPSGVARLAVETWLDYFESAKVMKALRWDRGESAFQSSTVLVLKDRLGVSDAGRLHLLETPSNRWYYLIAPYWVMILALAPLICLFVLLTCRLDLRFQMVFLTLLVCCITGALAFGATGVVPRYLHPLGWLMIIPFALIFQRVAILFRLR